MLLILACYIDGIRIGWRFNLFGNFLGLTAVLIAYLDNFMCVVYALVAISIAITVYVDRRKSV